MEGTKRRILVAQIDERRLKGSKFSPFQAPRTVSSAHDPSFKAVFPALIAAWYIDLTALND